MLIICILIFHPQQQDYLRQLHDKVLHSLIYVQVDKISCYHTSPPISYVIRAFDGHYQLYPRFSQGTKHMSKRHDLQRQIMLVAFFLIIYGAHIRTFFIVKERTLFLINCSPPTYSFISSGRNVSSQSLTQEEQAMEPCNVQRQASPTQTIFSIGDLWRSNKLAQLSIIILLAVYRRLLAAWALFSLIIN